MFGQRSGLGQQAQEDLVSRRRISELPGTKSSLPTPVAKLGVLNRAKPLVLGRCIVAEPLQGLALSATRDTLTIIGFDPMHVGSQSSDHSHLEFFPYPPLAGQADISHVANYPLGQPAQPLCTVAKSRPQKEGLSSISRRSPSHQRHKQDRLRVVC